ncbi:hypothetical protein RHSIM_Rhsim05G0067800 [Rhododendron simsii]|uniref:GAGA-binding transcriptional activator n=1 Tax=Rhododendron simsii TaxID=118357 RepID=A0A834H7N6_RHOSS|nr:hypothetical protein RHSIM_Rhsim05G0067800 [Rhododendron simsii]
MDDNGGQHDHGSHRVDYYRGVHPQWNTMPQYQMKDANAAFMNKKIMMHIIAERNAAIEEAKKADTEKEAALQERNEAIKQRDEAVAARDTAFRERDSAIAALRFHEKSVNGILGYGIQRGTKRSHHQTNHPSVAPETPFNGREAQTNYSFPISEEGVKPRPAKRGKGNKAASNKVSTKSPKKGKKVGEDLNRQVTTDGSKAEWDAQDHDLINQIDFDDYSMPPPVCSCTGLLRQCYKWGNGGWQSACCTTTLSQYPLPQMPNKRHARMGGRKMSGTVFARLLTRLAGEGHDLSVPLDLRNFWAKHGTNRYITIK